MYRYVCIDMYIHVYVYIYIYYAGETLGPVLSSRSYQRRYDYVPL